MPENNNYNIDFSDIMGGFSSGAGGNVSDIMNYLFQTLSSAGYEDFGAFEGGYEDIYENADIWTGDSGYAGSGGGQDWGSFTEWLQGGGGTSGQQGSVLEQLGSMLEFIDPENLQEQYTSGFSDITGAYQTGMQNLKKSQGVGSKGGRYGKVATGGRNVGKKGGRQQYMSDYYDLTSNYQSGLSNLQSGIEGSFGDAMMQYMTMNPSLEDDE